MIGLHKTFSQRSFNNADPRARVEVINYMKQLGFTFIDNPDKYGVDLISLFSNDKLELERRAIWCDDAFPYPTVHIPARKARVLGSDNVHYVVINNTFDRIGIIHGSKLKNYAKDEKAQMIPNRAVPVGEYFFDIPASEFKWIKIKEIALAE